MWFEQWNKAVKYIRKRRWKLNAFNPGRRFWSSEKFVFTLLIVPLAHKANTIDIKHKLRQYQLFYVNITQVINNPILWLSNTNTNNTLSYRCFNQLIVSKWQFLLVYRLLLHGRSPMYLLLWYHSTECFLAINGEAVLLQ